VGIFDGAGAAEQARTRLLEAGVRSDRIVLSVEVSEDDIAAEAPGQSFDNQPGQPPEDEVRPRHGEAVRGGARVLSVRAETQAETKRFAELLRRMGARNSPGSVRG
jgi:hypothetical protein